MKKTIAFLLLGGLLVAAIIAWKARAGLGEALFENRIKASMSRDVVRELDAGLHVALCGTGSPMSDPARVGPCTAVIAGNRLYIVDVGEGAARNFGPMGLRLDHAEAVFLTHFHSDHINGLGDLLIQRWANAGSDMPLDVYGPIGTNGIVDAFNTLLEHDRDYRIMHHGDDMPLDGFGGQAIEFVVERDAPVVVLDQNGLQVTAIQVDHGGIHPAVAYRFDYQGRSVVISGDTSQSEAIEELAADADILLHEALQPDMIDTMSAGFQESGRPRLARIFQDIKKIHTTPVEAAESAGRADVGLLVLTHIIPPTPSTFLHNYYLKGTGDHFSGPIFVGRDGMLFSLPAGKDDIVREQLN